MGASRYIFRICADPWLDRWFDGVCLKSGGLFQERECSAASFSQMKWLKGIGYALAAALIAVGFGMLGRPARKQKRAEAQRDNLLLDGSRKSREKAIKFDENANKHQSDGV